METTATHYHIRSELAQMITLSMSDDIGAFRWLDVHANDDRYQTLIGNHAEMVNRAVSAITASTFAAPIAATTLAPAITTAGSAAIAATTALTVAPTATAPTAGGGAPVSRRGGIERLAPWLYSGSARSATTRALSA